MAKASGHSVGVGSWVKVLGVERGRLTGRKYVRWKAQIVGMDRRAGTITVRYAMKQPRMGRRMTTKLYTLNKRSVVDVIDDITRDMKWKIDDGIEMLLLASEIAL